MNNMVVKQYAALIARELQEHRNLFIGGPLILAALLLMLLVWVVNFGSVEVVTELLINAGQVTAGMSGLDIAPLLLPTAIPFAIVLAVSLFAYLISTLYQDRRDLSILFWQSMPVSNANTVISKLAVAGLVAPLVNVAILLVLLLVLALAVVIFAAVNDVATITLWQMLVAIVYGSLLMYLTLLLSFLWLLTSVGWLLLFSAFARSQPFVWAIGMFMLVTLLEGLLFDTGYIANWGESRSGLARNLVLQPADFFTKLFSYDMLFGIALGCIFVAGAIFMRRFTD